MSSEAAVPFPDGKYGVILADPAWRFQNWSMSEFAERGEKWARRNGRSPYDVMDTAAICALPVRELAAKDCVLFCWGTWPKLQDALRVIEAWGFTYKTCAFCWVKTYASGEPTCGLGYWTRSASEFCLLATRGKPKRIDRRVRQVLLTPRREHSRKPDEIYECIERLVEGPYIELFARHRRPGWAAWGNQLPEETE